MDHYKPPLISAAAVITTGTMMVFHELAHVLAGWLAGGSPTVLTATEVQGEFGSLSTAGYAALGLSGFVVNILFWALGWWLLRRVQAGGRAGLFAWFLFAMNGFILTTAMISEPLIGWGDWMTILSRLPFSILLRVLVAVLGSVGLVMMVRRSGSELARIIPAGKPEQRTAEARRIVVIGAAASVILVLGGSVANPIGTLRGILLALGAGLVPFIPMIFGIRFVSRFPGENTRGPVSAGWPWLLAAGLTVGILWFVVGPGIMLPNILP